MFALKVSSFKFEHFKIGNVFEYSYAYIKNHKFSHLILFFLNFIHNCSFVVRPMLDKLQSKFCDLMGNYKLIENLLFFQFETI